MGEENQQTIRNRRRTDSCLAKRLWEQGTPYLQLGGWLPIIVGVLTGLYMLYGFIIDTQAYGPAIDRLNDKLGEDHDTIVRMGQEVHDMHEWMRRGQE